ncbi:MAG: hypothetical protein FWD52_08020 [Candidatus Bathyarchaeota archaeon]|nr:hypothetical protein [Candidatus Termiticorpusculum sp.]
MTAINEPIFYTLYLDSSGDSGWCAPYGKSPVRYYVNAGLALTDEAKLMAEKEVKDILEKYVDVSVVKYVYKIEIVYHDIIHGYNAFSVLKHEDRLNLSNEPFCLFEKLKPVMFATVVDKFRLKERYGNVAYNPKELAVRATIGRFSKFLENQNCTGTVIMDREEASTTNA